MRCVCEARSGVHEHVCDLLALAAVGMRTPFDTLEHKADAERFPVCLRVRALWAEDWSCGCEGTSVGNQPELAAV